MNAGLSLKIRLRFWFAMEELANMKILHWIEWGCEFDTLSNEFFGVRLALFYRILAPRPRKPTRSNGKIRNTFICPLESFSKPKNEQKQWRIGRSAANEKAPQRGLFIRVLGLLRYRKAYHYAFYQIILPQNSFF